MSTAHALRQAKKCDADQATKTPDAGAKNQAAPTPSFSFSFINFLCRIARHSVGQIKAAMQQNFQFFRGLCSPSA